VTARSATEADLPQRTRRRLALRAVLRPTLTATCLVVVYFALPLKGHFTLATAVELAGGLLIFIAMVVWHTRAIARSAYPRLRAIEAFAMAIPLFVLLFATVYVLLGNNESGAFSEPMTRTDALYFTITLFSTVGFGDIVPLSQPARILAMVQMLGDLIVIGLAAQVLLNAVRRGLRRQASDAVAEEDE
jgi:hypothetical protein